MRLMINTLESILKATGLNILEFFNNIIIGSVIIAVIMAIIWVVAKGWCK